MKADIKQHVKYHSYLFLQCNSIIQNHSIVKVALRALTLFIITLFCFINTSAKVFEFPITRDGIYVFYDQIPHNATEAQLNFAARNFVGCQKIFLDMVNTIKRSNPKFIVLNYRLSFGSYDTISSYLSCNEWINDWDSVSAHSDWFITSENSTNEGKRVRQMDWGWFLMDISGNVNGNTTNGWKEYWTRSTIKSLRETRCDGVFADSYCLPWGLDFTPEWLIPPNDIAWIEYMEIFGNYVQNALKSQPEQYYFIPNVGPWITLRDYCDYTSFSDGVMVEMFASPGAFDLYDIEDWKLQMNRILGSEKKGKIIICQSITEDEWAASERIYNLANYLLIKGDRTYYNLVFGESFYDRLIFLPECRINLGEFTDELPFDIDNYFDETTQLFTRRYKNGIIYVNPTWETRNITLDKEYYTIDINALAANPRVDVLEDGSCNDSLKFKSISGNVTLGHKSGLILLNAITGVDESITKYSPAKPGIKGIFRNKVNMGYNISLELANERYDYISIEIYDIYGKVLNEIAVETNASVSQSLYWNGRDYMGNTLSSGIYLVILKAIKNGQINNIDFEKLINLD